MVWGHDKNRTTENWTNLNCGITSTQPYPQNISWILDLEHIISIQSKNNILYPVISKGIESDSQKIHHNFVI